MKKITHTMEEWVQLVENELLAGNFTKALEIKLKLSKSENKSGLFQPIYNRGWLAIKNGNIKVAEGLFSWLEQMDPKSWQAHLANAMLSQKLAGKKTASKKFRAFVKSNPIYENQGSSNKNPINIATLLTTGKGDISFASGGFKLPYGLTESQHLTQHSKYRGTMLFCESISSKQINQFDILINAVSDADLYSGLLVKLKTLLTHSNIPIINHPQNILKNTRDNLSRSIPPDIEIIMPKTIRVMLHEEQKNSLACQINKNELHYPILIRPIGSQTGQGLVRLDTENQAKKYQCITGWFYITEFYDFRSKDGNYRKYRCWSIGDQVVPNHLFINAKWNVHGTSRFEYMIKNNWMIDEEQSFIDGDSKIYNDNILKMIATIKYITGLDYFGVDFGFTQNGMPILFEANPTMRSNYPEWAVQFPYTKDVHHRYVNAFRHLIDSKIKNAN